MLESLDNSAQCLGSSLNVKPLSLLERLRLQQNQLLKELEQIRKKIEFVETNPEITDKISQVFTLHY